MAYEFATYEKKGRIAVVTINRPERMNALHPPANLELHEIWDDFERDPDVWVGILTGAGDKAFSAGNDLRYTAEHGRDMVRFGRQRLRRPRRTGPRAGSRSSRRSTATPSAAASRWRSRATSSSPPITPASACPSRASASWLAPAACTGCRGMIPQKIAMGYILTGRHMTAQEAHRWGIVNEVVPLPQLMPTAMKWAGEILECAPLSVRASKQAALMGFGHPLEVALAHELHRADRMRRSEDTVEGPRAFAEKRKPNWKAR